MKNPNKLWRDLTYRFSKQSRCYSRNVGAIIVSADNRLIAEGWNSAPEGSACTNCPRCKNRNKKTGENLELAICTHAEANAIGYAASAGIKTSGCTLYSTTIPCAECAKLIIAAGIKKVVAYEDYPSKRITTDLFRAANVEFEYVDLDLTLI